MAARARFAELSGERDLLFAERTGLPPQQQVAMTARIAAIGAELAAMMTPPSPPPVGWWG